MASARASSRRAAFTPLQRPHIASHSHSFAMWLAGGGVKGGTVIGATDDVGLRAAVDRTHVHDVHATMLHLLGFDHERLTFRHSGRDERLTDVAGKVIERALA